MDKFFTLYKVNLSSLFGLNKKLHGKKGLLKGLLGLLALVVLIAGLSALYAWTFLDAAMPFGDEKPDVVVSFIAVASLATFMFSFYATSSQLFGTHDYELLASMPIKKHQVVFAKLASIVTANVIISLLIVIPAMVVQQTMCQNIYPMKGVLYIVCALFACFLPIALATLIGTLFTLLTARLKRKNLVLILLYLSLFVAFYLAPATSIAESLYEIIEILYIPYKFLTGAVENFGVALLFIAFNLIPFAVVTLFVSLIYDKLNTWVKSRKTSSSYKIKKVKNSKPLFAFVKKELKRLFSTPIYALNSGIGALIPIFFIVSSFISVGDGLSILGEYLEIDFLFLFLFLFCYCISPITVSSISMEGKNLWQVKTLPISAKTVLNAKLVTHLIIYLSGAIITTILYSIVFKLKFVAILLTLLSACTCAVFSGVVGLFVNLKLPVLDWKTPTKPVKQSGAVGVMIGISFAFAALYYFMLDFLLSNEFEFLSFFTPRLVAIVQIILLLAITVILYIHIIKNSQKYLDKI